MAKLKPGHLPTSWHSNKFLNPVHDGAVLPILHLNGYKIANPALLARISHDELEKPVRRLWLSTLFCRGIDPELMHQAMAAALDIAIGKIRTIQHAARGAGQLWRLLGCHVPSLADDHPAQSQGLDRAERG